MATTQQSKEWFTVDKDGLADILERRGKEFAVLELISNAFDQNVHVVVVNLRSTEKRGTALLEVIDDDPDGFTDLTHAYRMFAPSEKKGDVQKRGRFNLGEKLVLAICDEATIISTTGGVVFDKDGRRATRQRRPVGSAFTAQIKLTRREVSMALDAVANIIVPPGIVFKVNDRTYEPRPKITTFSVALPTEIADEDGLLRRTTRITEVDVYEPFEGEVGSEVGSVYELGIPVVETGDRYSYDVRQKVPINMDRDNVPPGFLTKLRTAALNATYALIEADDASRPWARDALASPDIIPEAVTRAMDLRFGEKRVIFDMSDPEANQRAAAQGYTVIHGNSLNKDEWANVRQHEAALPAGRVTPSPKIFSENGAPVHYLDYPSPAMRRIEAYSEAMASALLGIHISVSFASDRGLPVAAMYGNRTLTFNVARLGHKFFEDGITERVDALLLHELAHERVSNHLDSNFADTVAQLGAKLVRWDGRKDHVVTKASP